MDFALTSDQEALRSSIRDFLEAECPPEVVRASYNDQPRAPELWRKAVEMGWPGLIVSEDLGGVGLGWVEAALLAEEMGRYLFPGPYMSTMAVTAGLILAGATEWIPPIANGSVVPAIALYEGRSLHRKEINMKARETADGYVLEGNKLFVNDGELANQFLVAVRVGEGWGLAIVPSDASGLTLSALPVVDKTRPQSALAFSEVIIAKDALILDPKGLIIDRLRDRACVLVAAEQAGIARKCMEMSVEYAKTRQQFEKPIGTYQAVSHKLSDMFLATEHSTSLAYYAAWAADRASSEQDLSSDAHQEAGLAAWRAKIWASQAAAKATADGIQVHGGIGFTWEHDLHMYFKRARSNEILFDEPNQLLDLIGHWGVESR